MLSLFLRFFEHHTLAQGRVKLRQFYFPFNFFLILPRPNDMLGLRGFQFKKAVLRHKNNLTESPDLGN